MAEVRGKILTVDGAGYRVNPWWIPLVGAATGVVSGSMSYLLQWWMNPAIIESPHGQYFWVVLYNVLFWTWWFCQFPLVLWLARHVRLASGQYLRAAVIHSSAAVVLAIAHGFVSGTLKYVLFDVSGYLDMPAAQGLTLLKLIQIGLLWHAEQHVLIYFGIVAMSHALQLNRELQQRELEESRLQARLVEARLESLQRQLHPHFVFNTLHAIAGLVHRSPDAAESMIVRLGDLLRAVFRSGVQQEVPLARELELAEQYLDIQRVRFGGSLRSEVDVPADLLQAPVPVLILQPLVENAIIHGFDRLAAGGGVIRIAARRRGTQMEIAISDDGRGMSGGRLRDLNEGVGLTNTRARLAHLYPGAHAIAFDPAPGGGFTVTLLIPAPAGDRQAAGDKVRVPA